MRVRDAQIGILFHLQPAHNMFFDNAHAAFPKQTPAL